MGYRSNVVIVCNNDFAKKLDKLIEEKIVEVNNKTKLKGSNDCLYEWSWSKWNSWYDDVRAVEALMDAADEEDEEPAYKFIRVGEEIGDVEIRSNVEDPDEVWEDFYIDTVIQKPETEEYSYVYTEYDTRLPFDERYVRIFASEKDAQMFLELQVAIYMAAHCLDKDDFDVFKKNRCRKLTDDGELIWEYRKYSVSDVCSKDSGEIKEE